MWNVHFNFYIYNIFIQPTYLKDSSWRYTFICLIKTDDEINTNIQFDSSSITINRSVILSKSV